MSTPQFPQDNKPAPLKVLVVGAGLGGLAAAISLRRQGHLVEVFESSSFHREIGAAIGIPPNAGRILKSFGYVHERLMTVEYKGMVFFGPQEGPGFPLDFGDTRKLYGGQWDLCYRADLHNELKLLAFGQEGEGPPAKLHLGSEVLECHDAELGILTLMTGETRQADLIIGADGIRSTIRTNVLGHILRAPPSGVSGYRWVTDASKLDGHPELDWILNDGPQGLRLLSRHGQNENDDYGFLILYPCRNKTLINAIGTHMDKRDQDSVGWNIKTTKEAVLREFHDIDPKFKSFIELAGDSDIRLWQIRSLPPLPTRYKGRVCLLGDAAHAMLPTLAQAAAQAIEDAGTLGVLLPPGTTRADVPKRLEAYNHLRQERTQYIQKESWEQVLIPEKRGLFFRSKEMMESVMGYDALGIAREYFEEKFGQGNLT